MYRLFVVATLLAVANAGEYQASSYSSFNSNHNAIQHSQSAPALIKYAAPALAKVAVPAAPIYPTVAKFVAPAAPAYAAPVFTQYAAPAIAKVAAPAYAAPVFTQYAAPAIAKVALPIAKVAPVAYAAPSYSSHQEVYAPAKYEFAYGIQDSHTGDYHSQEEHRDGDHVVGQYSLHEADGTVRIVKYSDDGHGFNAVVERQGHPAEAPAVLKKVVAVAAPLYHH